MKTRAIRVTVPISIETDTEGYHAYAPALAGCHVGGDTREEARANIEVAVRLYLASLIKHGEAIPQGCTVECHLQTTTDLRRVMRPLIPDQTIPAQSQGDERLDIAVPIAA